MPLQFARFLPVTGCISSPTPRRPFPDASLSPKSFAEDPMVDAWAALASWATPTALFILLNVVIGFIAVFASRKNDDPPPPDHHNQFQYHHQQQQQQIHRHEESPQRLVRAPSLFSRITSFDFSNLNYSVSSHHHSESAAVHEAVPYTSSVNDAAPPPLARAPSLLSRMTSFSNFYTPAPATDEKHLPPQPAADVAPAPSLLARMASVNRFSLTKSVKPDQLYPPAESSDESHPPIERSPSLLSRMASINFSLHRSTEPEPKPAESAAPVEAREEHLTRSATESKKKKPPPAGNKMKKSSSEKTETTSLGHNDDSVDAKADDFINRFKQQLRLQRLDSLLRYRSSAGGS